MGAGVQRWWQDGSRYRRECAAWLGQRMTIIDQRIISAPRRDLSKVRPLMQAHIDLWKVIREQP